MYNNNNSFISNQTPAFATQDSLAASNIDFWKNKNEGDVNVSDDIYIEISKGESEYKNLLEFVNRHNLNEGFTLSTAKFQTYRSKQNMLSINKGVGTVGIVVERCNALNYLRVQLNTAALQKSYPEKGHDRKQYLLKMYHVLGDLIREKLKLEISAPIFVYSLFQTLNIGMSYTARNFPSPKSLSRTNSTTLCYDHGQNTAGIIFERNLQGNISMRLNEAANQILMSKGSVEGEKSSLDYLKKQIKDVELISENLQSALAQPLPAFSSSNSQVSAQAISNSSHIFQATPKPLSIDIKDIDAKRTELLALLKNQLDYSPKNTAALRSIYLDDNNYYRICIGSGSDMSMAKFAQICEFITKQLSFKFKTSHDFYYCSDNALYINKSEINHFLQADFSNPNIGLQMA